MNTEDKAQIYDSLIRESDILQRTNSRLKSEYVGNIPPNIQTQIDANNAKIALLVGRLEDLLR